MHRRNRTLTALVAALSIPFAAAPAAPTSAFATTSSSCILDASATAQHSFWDLLVNVGQRKLIYHDQTSFAPILTVDAISGTNMSDNDRSDVFYQRFYTHDGALYFVQDRQPDVSSSTTLGSTTWKIASSGWGAVTRLVNVSDHVHNNLHGYMYALAPSKHRIYRYKVDKPQSQKTGPTVTHAGYKGGFWHLKSLTLAAKTPDNTYLLATTTDGRLRLITIANTSTFKLSIKTVRTSGWKHLNYLAVGGGTCHYGNRLLAVNTKTDWVRLYRFKIANGTAVLDYRGRFEGWPYRRTSSAYTFGDYPWTS